MFSNQSNNLSSSVFSIVQALEEMDKRDGRKLLLEHLEKSISFFSKSLHLCFEFLFKKVKLFLLAHYFDACSL